MADMEQLIPESTSSSLLDTILHYALFLGAIFQLVCIFAVIFVPPRQDEKVSILLLTSLKLSNIAVCNRAYLIQFDLHAGMLFSPKHYITQLPLKTH